MIQSCEEIDRLIERRASANDLRLQVHRLGGSAACYGAERLSHVAVEMERACVHGDLSGMGELARRMLRERELLIEELGRAEF